MLKIEAGKKYRTRGGDEVEILRTDLNSSDPIAGIVTCKDTGNQSVTSFKEDGSYFEGEIHLCDIISEIKPKRVVWMNVYEGDEGACFFPSRQKADDEDRKYGDINGARIACIRVEFEENQFDD